MDCNSREARAIEDRDMKFSSLLLYGIASLFASTTLGQVQKHSENLFGAPAIPPEKGYFVQEIRGGLYWVTDGLYNTIFLVSAQGVIAIDPLPNLGERYLKAIAEITNKPITHVIYSHEHTDHIGAAYLFPKDAVYIAQKKTAELLARRNDPRRPVPTLTFDETYTLTVGDQTVVLDYKGPNHESGNIFIYAPRQKVLMLVDVIYPGWMPYKNLGIAEDVPGYIEAHHDALSYDFEHEFGSPGSPIP
jgi:glyoxylase-like metal-dependent hydrolase (beta-lactamase superfamily II)